LDFRGGAIFCASFLNFLDNVLKTYCHYLMLKSLLGCLHMTHQVT